VMVVDAGRWFRQWFFIRRRTARKPQGFWEKQNRMRSSSRIPLHCPATESFWKREIFYFKIEQSPTNPTRLSKITIGVKFVCARKYSSVRSIPDQK
jgi:hypothetical protein